MRISESEFRKVVREEVRKTLSEDTTIQTSDPSSSDVEFISDPGRWKRDRGIVATLKVGGISAHLKKDELSRLHEVIMKADKKHS